MTNAYFRSDSIINYSKLIEIKYANSDGTKNKKIHVEVKKTKKLPVLKCTKNEITEYSQQYQVIKVTGN